MKKDNDALKKAVCRLLIVLAMSGTVLASSSTLFVYAQESIPPVLSVPEVSTPGEVQPYTQQSNFEYEKYVDPLGNWEIRLTKYLGEKTDGTTVVIPHTIEGLPVEETDANLLAGIPNVIVEFEQGTTRIPDLVCYQKDNVAKLVIPDTVTEIGYYTFEGCQNLREIVWGGRQVLENGKLTIPSGVTGIGNNAFKGMVQIQHVVLPATLEYGSHDMFSDIPNLTIEFAQGTVRTANYALGAANGLTKLIVPGSVTKIGYGSFEEASQLREIIWNGQSILQDKKLIIPEGVQEICSYAFTGMDINYLCLPSTFIGAAEGYGSDRSIVMNIPDLTVEFAQGSTTLPEKIFVNSDQLKKVILPSTVTEIQANAFMNCEGLTQISWGGQAMLENGKLTLPKGLRLLGETAFLNMTQVKHIVLSSTLESYPSSLGVSGITLEFAQGTTNLAKNMCSGTWDTIIIPNSVTQLDAYSFKNCQVRELIWNGQSALAGGKLTIPEGITKIGQKSVSGINGVNYIVLPSTLQECEGFYSSPNITTLEFAEGTTKLPLTACAGAQNLTTVILPDTVKEIGQQAFENCSSLESIELPQVTYIGDYAFRGCSRLKQLDVSYAQQVKSGAFSDCSSLTELSLNGKLLTIERDTFSNCTNLKKVVINGAAVIDKTAFSYSPNVTLYSSENSMVHEFANAWHIPFQPLEISPTTLSFSTDSEQVTMVKNGSNTPVSLVNLANKIQIEGEPVFTTPFEWKIDPQSGVIYDTNLILYATPGKAALTLSCGELSAQYVFEVQVVSEARIDPEKLLLQVGDTYQLDLSIQPEGMINPEDIVFSTPDWDIADCVQPNGWIEAKNVTDGQIPIDAKFSLLSSRCYLLIVQDKNFVQDVVQLENEHNTNMEKVWSYQLPGVESLDITFDERTSYTQMPHSFVLYNRKGEMVGSYACEELAGKTLTVAGDAFSIYYSGSADDWGFKITSVTEHIVPDEITSDVYPIDENKRISGIQPGSTLSSIEKDLVGEGIKVFTAKGQAVASDMPLGTGYILTLGEFGDVSQLTVVVSGDIDGDAKVAVADTIYMKQAMLGNRILEGAYQKAATFKSGSQEGPAVSDFTTMKQFMLGKISILK